MRKQILFLVIEILIGFNFICWETYQQDYEITDIEENIAQMCLQKLGIGGDILIQYSTVVENDLLVVYWNSQNQSICGLSLYQIGNNQKYRFYYMSYDILNSPQRNQLVFANPKYKGKQFNIAYGVYDDLFSYVEIVYAPNTIRSIDICNNVAFDVSETCNDFYLNINVFDQFGRNVKPLYSTTTIKAGSIQRE